MGTCPSSMTILFKSCVQRILQLSDEIIGACVEEKRLGNSFIQVIIKKSLPSGNFTELRKF